MKSVLNNFFRGMLIVIPVSITIYITYATLTWMNDFFNRIFFSWFDFEFPGLGILTAFAAITLIGFIISRTFVKPIVLYFEKLFVHTPLINIVYSSLKDLTEAFVGDKKRFNKPVYVALNDSGMKRLGFITADELNHLKLEGEVAVYCPHSYNFSGNLYIVPRDQVTPVKTDSADFMRFIVSGGVTRIENR